VPDLRTVTAAAPVSAPHHPASRPEAERGDGDLTEVSGPSKAALSPSGRRIAIMGKEAIDGRRGVRRVASPPGAARREQAIRLGRLKRWLVAGSVAAFGAFCGLSALHVTGITARAAAPSRAQGGGATAGASAGDYFGGGGSDGGYGFGSAGSSGAPAASTGVS
jgi:hypothetical protein